MDGDEYLPVDEDRSNYCPYCGETVELDVDESGGSRQSYVEDCPVCCQPWQVEVVQDREGVWHVPLPTSDE